MKVKRFFAPDMSTAMRTVREEVGSDAVILSNNSVAGGVEVVVALDYADGPQVAIKPVAKQKKPAANVAEKVNAALERESSQASAKALVGMKKPVRTAEDLQRARQRMSAQMAKRSAESLMQSKSKDNQLNFNDEVWDDVLAALGKEDRISKAPESLSREHSALENEVDQALKMTRNAKPTSTPVKKIRQRLAIDEDVPHLKEVAQPEHEEIRSMRNEIDELKAMLRNRLNDSVVEQPPTVDVSQNPIVDRLTLQFARMNVQSGLSAKLLQGIEADQSIDKAWKVSLRRLSDAIPTVGEDLTERGGLLAFVGATGVGKTTTIGKLATRYVLKHGSAGIALVTTDSYRIAAHEQLKTFGRILDIPVRVVDENNPLDVVLDTLRDKRLILIDTSGMGGQDQVRSEQLEMLSDSSYRIKKVMVLPSTAQYGVLEASYQQFKTMGLNAVVLSKVDEAVSLGEALSFVAEKRLPLAYLADGQKIPDNIEVARANAFVSRAVMLSEQSVKNMPSESADRDVVEFDRLQNQRVG